MHASPWVYLLGKDPRMREVCWREREHQMLPSCEGTLIGRKQEEKQYAYRDVHP